MMIDNRNTLIKQISSIIKMMLVIIPVLSGLIISIGIKNQVATNIKSLSNSMYITIGLCVFFIVLYTIFLAKKDNKLTKTILTNIIFITICTLGIHFSGGIESPLYYILLIYLVILGLSSNHEPKLILSITLTSCTLYTSFILLEHFNIIPYVPFSYGEHGEIMVLSFSNQVLLLIIRNSLMLIAGFIPTYLLKNLSKEHDKFIEVYNNLQKQEHLLIQAEKMSSLGELTSGITHEIKNQLTSISIFAQLATNLLEQKNPNLEDLKDFAKTISQATQNSINYITSLLKFSRGPTLDEEDKLVPLNINEALDSAINLVQHQLTINKIKIEKHLNQSLPLVKGNRAQLEQVFLNLIINSKDALSNKKEDAKITVTTSVAERGKVLISFTDNGCGICKEYLDKIFTPFFSTKEKGKGTGLGLSVSRHLTEESGGKITVESTINVGTTFYVILPSIQFNELFSKEIKEEDKKTKSMYPSQNQS